MAETSHSGTNNLHTFSSLVYYLVPKDACNCSRTYWNL